MLLSTYTVTSTADVAASAPNYPGTLRWAVAQANAAGAPASNPSVITFSPSLFGAGGATPQTITLTQGQLLFTGGVTNVTGPGANLLTVSGNNASGVFFILNSGNASLSGLTLTGGTGSGAVNGGTLSITACFIAGNSATYGGGVDNIGTSLTLNACTISNNTASSTGGGGGIYSQAKITITNCTISGNTGGSGGGIYNDSTSTLTVSDSTLSGNSANIGGGIYNVSPATLNNTIVAANTSTNTPGDLYTVSVSTFSGPFAGSNNLVGNGANETGLANGTNGNQVGTAAAPINPKLGALQNNGGLTPTLALLPGSPALDAGSGTAIPTGVRTDQRGYIRTANGSVDIGAYEFDAAPPSLEGPTLAVNSTGDGDFVPGELTLRQALSLAADENAPIDQPINITFSPLIFSTPQTITLTQGRLIMVNGGVDIAGPGANLLTLSGNSASAVIFVGIGLHGSISGVRIASGSSSIGAGLYNAGTVALSACVLTGGSAIYGGGIANSSFGNLTVNACTITGNSSSVAGGGGAGIYNAGILAVINCTIAGNTVSSTNGAGGGIYNDSGSSLTLSDSTIAGNSAATAGGIYNFAPATLNNCIVATNTGNGGDLFTKSTGTFSGSNNLIGNGTSETGLTNASNGNQVGTAAAPVNPKLGLLQNNGGTTPTMALLAGSPAIDAGSNALIPTGVATDQRGPGNPRIINDVVDIGAYESLLPVPAWLDPASAANWKPSSKTLTVTGTATIIADPGIDEPNIVASGSAAKLAITPATSPTDVHIGGATLSGGASITVTGVASRSHSNHNVLVIGPAGASADPTVSIDSSSKLDLGSNDLIVHTGTSDSTGQSELTAFRALAQTGRGVPAGGVLDGTWTGNGLTSSAAAAADKMAGYEQNVLAVVRNDDQILGTDTKWTVGSASESIGARDIIVKYTYNGDAALEGYVGDDSVTIVNGLYDGGKSTQADWAFGDFTGVGQVNDNDITILNGLYGNGTAASGLPQL